MASREAIVAAIVTDREGAYIPNPYDDEFINREDHDGFVIMWYFVAGVPYTVQIYTNVSDSLLANVRDARLFDAFAEKYTGDGLECHADDLWEKHDPASGRRVAAAARFLTSPSGFEEVKAPVVGGEQIFPMHVLLLLGGPLMEYMDILCPRPLALSPLGPDFGVLPTDEPLFVAYTQIGRGEVNPAHEAGVWSVWAYRHHSLIGDGVSLVMHETPTGWIVTYVSEEKGMPLFCVVQISRLIEGGQTWTPTVHTPAFDESSIMHKGMGAITYRFAIYRGIMTTWEAYVAWALELKTRARISVPSDFLLENGTEVSAVEVYDHAADLDLVEPRVVASSPRGESPFDAESMAGAIVPFGESGFDEVRPLDFDSGSDSGSDAGVEELDQEQAKALAEFLEELGSTETTIDDFMACTDPGQIFALVEDDGRIHIGNPWEKKKYSTPNYVFHDGYDVGDLLDLCMSGPNNSNANAFIAATRAAKNSVYPAKPAEPTAEQAQEMRLREVSRMSCKELTALLGVLVFPHSIEMSREHAAALMAVEGTIPGYESLMSHYNLIMSAGTMGAQDTGGSFLETLHRATSDRLLALSVKNARMDGKPKHAATLGVKARIHDDIAGLMDSGAAGVDADVLADYIADDHCSAYAGDFATEAMRAVIVPYKKAQVTKIITQLCALENAPPEDQGRWFAKLASEHWERARKLETDVGDIVEANALLWSERASTKVKMQMHALEADLEAIEAQIKATGVRKRMQDLPTRHPDAESNKRAHTLRRRRRSSSSSGDSDDGGVGSSRSTNMTLVE